MYAFLSKNKFLGPLVEARGQKSITMTIYIFIVSMKDCFLQFKKRTLGSIYVCIHVCTYKVILCNKSTYFDQDVSQLKKRSSTFEGK